jgi:transposase InsO family protein
VVNLTRGMELTGLDQLWVADITYVHLAEEFAYLAIVLDAFSRKVIGWRLATHLRAELAIAALDMALAARRLPPGSLIHHSDRGVQYACGDYTAIQHRIGQQLLQPGVLGLERLQPTRTGDIHAPVLRLPAIKAGAAHPVLPA